MNRRNFLGRAVLVGAAVPAIKHLTGPVGGALSGQTEPLESTDTLPVAPKEYVRFPDDPNGDVFERIPTPEAPDARVIVNRTAALKREIQSLENLAVTAPAVVETVTQPDVPFYEDRLKLLQMRGLMAPCPNCHTGWKVTNWRKVQSERPFIECGTCGWRDVAEHYESLCQCSECRDSRWNPGVRLLTKDDATDAPLLYVLATAPFGLYRITEYGRPVERRILNAYDVSTDRIVHHAIEQQWARVTCAVRALSQPYGRSGPGFETHRRPNGDPVLLSWCLVDSYEQQVERGEKPPITYERDADGHARLIQGVKA